jgi:hypothetical protein
MDMMARVMGRDVSVWGRNAVVGNAATGEELYAYDQALSWPTILAAAAKLDISAANAADAFFVSKGTATMTIAAPCVASLTTHTLATGDAVKFTTTGALPTGLTASATYYAKVINANTFNLHTTRADAIAGTNPITTTGTQSGTHTLFIPGTGANSIMVFGLDGSYNPQWEEIALAGTTPVTTVKSYLRLFGAEVTRSGSGKVNAGNIHIIKTGTAGAYTTPGIPDTLTSALCLVLAGWGSSQNGMYTVPAGKTATLKGLILNARSQACTFWLVSQRLADTEDNSLHIDFPVEVNVTNGVLITPGDLGMKLTYGEKTDIRLRVFAAAASGIATGTIILEVV